MYEQVEKPKENKNKAVANSALQKKSSVKQGFGFVDNRPISEPYRVLQAMRLDSKVIQMEGGGKVEGHKHSNPYDPETEKLKYDLFEKDWKENKSMKNRFLGLWPSKREERETRVKERVEGKVINYRSRQDSFIKSDDLPLEKSYHNERDKENHPYTGFHGKGQPVDYLSKEERGMYDAKLAEGKLTSKTVHTPHSEEGVNTSETKKKKVIFTRRGSQDDLSAMIKESQGKDGKKRTQHSTFNSGQDVANAGYLEFGDEGKLNKVKLSSGHYAPDKTSGIKLRMWAEKNNKFGEETEIVDHDSKLVDTSEVARVEAVDKWSSKHPKKKQDELV